MRREVPASPEAAAEALRSMAAEGLRLRPVGGGTKLGWGGVGERLDAEVATAGLAGIKEHNAADLTATLGAGTRLAAAQDAFAEAGQMLALDPPGGADQAATVGGVVATGDSGPLRHRYGAARDLLLGMQVALSDGSLARSGGKVIKNVAGYDLAKLFSGSFGTLGLICEVVVRLHPLPQDRVTVVGRSDDAVALQATTLAAAAAPLELESLDVVWSKGEGAVLARLGGASADLGAEQVARIARQAGVSVQWERDDESLWEDQRRRQRAPAGAGVRVSALATELARVTRCADRLGAGVVGRAALGLFWLSFPPGDAGDLVTTIEEVRADLSPYPCVLLDAPEEVRAKLDPWGDAGGSELELMRRVKARFDPAGAFSPGVFVGGI
jgi:glycolate oxidase FAD binding subunit